MKNVTKANCTLGICATLALVLLPGTSFGQNSMLFKQISNSDSVTILSAAEKLDLGDPFFNLVLKNNPGVRNLKAIHDLIQPDKSHRDVFVVSEEIAKADNQNARTAFSYTGTHKGENLGANVMLSTSISSQGHPDELSFLEAWGWDNHRGVYNYYRLDTVATNVPTWKFKGSSQRVDKLTHEERRGTCFECHVNGAPLMKELIFPWNNWFSFKFKPPYLDPDIVTAQSWPILRDADFKNSLKGADVLEGQIFSSIRRFNRQRLNDVLKRDDATGNRAVDPQGRGRVMEAKRLLKPLFEATEINVISSDNRSGTHPFLPPNQFVPNNPIKLPPSFFVNSDLISGGGFAGLTGLGLPSARQFNSVKGPTQMENRALLQKENVRFANRVPGDTLFGWLVPQRSFIDNHMVDLLLEENVVSRQFVAAVLRVDLKHPVFSEKRAGLQKFLPDHFDFHFDGTGEDLLIKSVIASIKAENAAPGSAANVFLDALESADAAADLEAKVKAYLTETNDALNGTPEERSAELERLMKLAIKIRTDFAQNENTAPLDEFDLLFPAP